VEEARVVVVVVVVVVVGCHSNQFGFGTHSAF
jgi:hypothetical protein